MIDINRIDRDIQESDQQEYLQLISSDLTPEQESIIARPVEKYPRQRELLAIHWHPENVPIPLVEQRLSLMFPNAGETLVIPTQHNILMSYGPYTGVEVDCYDPSFNRKVQLLFHFQSAKLKKADVLKSMLAHTFKYRSSQLFEFIDTIIEPQWQDRVDKAAAQTGADENLVEFVRIYTRKLHQLIEKNYTITPPDAIKNKLVRNYFETLSDHYDRRIIERAQIFLTAIKKIVKANFSLHYFYESREIIEEARSLGAGIVIPHPEQFWPILLAEYDVDGYEVWNPQSQEYTKFLIDVVRQQNKTRPAGKNELLIFMGDDTHLSEKIKEPRFQMPDKANREIGIQPAWDDLEISKSLNLANFNRAKMIQAYKERLK